MNSKLIWIIIAVLILGVLGWYAFAGQEVAAPTTQETPSAETEGVPSGDSAYAALVALTDDGFSPASVTVNQGETVRFVNQSARGMWVGSDDHPTHTEYDGTTTREHCKDGVNTTGAFDQCAAAPAGSFWEFTFEKSGTFGYHNHTGASHTGTVIVR